MKKLQGLNGTSSKQFSSTRWRKLLIYFCLLCSVETTLAQRKTLDLSMKDVPLITVMDAIKRQTDYQFSYDVEIESTLKEKKVTIKTKDEPIEQVLAILFSSTGIGYKVVDFNILLLKKKSNQETVENTKTLLQTVKGRVVDKESKIPLIGVNITLRSKQFSIATATDTSGRFSFKVPVGMQSLQFIYTGYEPYITSDLSIISGKETFLNVEMRESVVMLNEVIVTSDNQKDRPLNSMATVSSRQLTTEDAGRYAAGFYDPARMASVFAGVVAADDGRNDIIIRGNSPMGLLWKLEGIEIPNPNHFNQGEGGSGGVFSIISSDVLTNSDFFTGAFPAEYGNATSGILDLNLRKGNADKHEFGIQVGMIGSQVSLEGPLGKNKKTAYLFNYRYGNLQFLNNLGLIGLDENQKPPIFQDLNFNINFRSKKSGTFSLFGIGGISSTGENSIKDSLSWGWNGGASDETEYHRMGVLGVNHTLTLPDNKTYLKTVIAVTDQYDKLESGILTKNYEYQVNKTSRYNYPSIRSAITLNHKFDARNTIRTGLIYNQLYFDIFGSKHNRNMFQGNQPDTAYRVYVDNKGQTGLAEAFFEWKHRVNDKLEINSGIHNSLFSLNNDYSIEPRLGLKWQTSSKSSVSYGFGLHSRAEPLSTYFAQVKSSDGTITTPNKDLKLTKAMHHVLGYDLALAPNFRFKAEVYYQYLYHVPIVNSPTSTYSGINSLYGIPDQALANKGKGYNKGIDVTLEKFYSSNYYFLLTGSIFDSKYKAGNGQLYNTYFNSRYQTNFLAGRDFKTGRTGQNIFSLNFKTLVHGGFNYTPQALITPSSGLPYLEPIISQTYANQMPYYLRMDMGLKYRKNNPRYSWIISLDVQNLTNRENVIDYGTIISPNNKIFLNPSTGIGIVPILNFKIEF